MERKANPVCFELWTFPSHQTAEYRLLAHVAMAMPRVVGNLANRNPPWKTSPVDDQWDKGKPPRHSRHSAAVLEMLECLCVSVLIMIIMYLSLELGIGKKLASSSYM